MKALSPLNNMSNTASHEYLELPPLPPRGPEPSILSDLFTRAPNRLVEALDSLEEIINAPR